jgi:hypothetical protein
MRLCGGAHRIKPRISGWKPENSSTNSVQVALADHDGARRVQGADNGGIAGGRRTRQRHAAARRGVTCDLDVVLDGDRDTGQRPPHYLVAWSPGRLLLQLSSALARAPIQDQGIDAIRWIDRTHAGEQLLHAGESAIGRDRPIAQPFGNATDLRHTLSLIRKAHSEQAYCRNWVSGHLPVK